jgi:hypothetical protein
MLGNMDSSIDTSDRSEPNVGILSSLWRFRSKHFHLRTKLRQQWLVHGAAPANSSAGNETGEIYLVELKEVHAGKQVLFYY